MGIDADGIVGPITRANLADHGIDLTKNPPLIVTPKVWPQSATDRELLEYLAEQAGPGHPDWTPNAPGGEVLTVRDSIAARGQALSGRRPVIMTELRYGGTQQAEAMARQRLRRVLCACHQRWAIQGRRVDRP